MALQGTLRQGLIPEENAETMIRFIGDGRTVYDHYLDHIHKGARAGKSPDIMRLNSSSAEFLKIANEFLVALWRIQQIDELDPSTGD